MSTTCTVCFEESSCTKYCCTQLCWSCYISLNSLCPICDRKEINKPIECEHCKRDVAIFDYHHNYWCDNCQEEFYDVEGCEDCLKKIHDKIHDIINSYPTFAQMLLTPNRQKVPDRYPNRQPRHIPRTVINF